LTNFVRAMLIAAQSLLTNLGLAITGRTSTAKVVGIGDRKIVSGAVLRFPGLTAHVSRPANPPAVGPVGQAVPANFGGGHQITEPSIPKRTEPHERAHQPFNVGL
jgi:hypothetical protein